MLVDCHERSSILVSQAHQTQAWPQVTPGFAPLDEQVGEEAQELSKKHETGLDCWVLECDWSPLRVMANDSDVLRKQAEGCSA